MAKILMVLDHAFPPDLRVENEIESLTMLGHEVSILAIGPDSRPTRDSIGNATIIRDRISASRRNRMRGLAGSIPIINAYLDRLINSVYKEWAFDVIHAHDLYLVGAALRTGRGLGVKVVADLHENWVAALKHYAWSNRQPAKFFNNLTRWDRLETEWSNAADGIIVVIAEMKDRLVEKGLDASKTLILPNTIHQAHFDNYGIDPTVVDSVKSELTLLYVGGMDNHRGIETAIRAMPKILEKVPGARLILVGDGAVRTDLEVLARGLGLDESIHFLGRQPQESIPSYVAGADIGLIPHIKTDHTDNTIPHKLFHYMHMGLPVVASNCRPIERIILETDSGIIHGSENSAELSAAVLKLSQSSDNRAKMGGSGKQAVASKYNWEMTSAGLEGFYRDLLK